MTPTERAYFAGILDGEGWIGLVNQGRGRRKRLQIEVTSTDEELVEWLHRVGGGYRPRTLQRGGNRKPEHRWRASGNIARKILTQVGPYLVIERKREQARRAMLS